MPRLHTGLCNEGWMQKNLPTLAYRQNFTNMSPNKALYATCNVTTGTCTLKTVWLNINEMKTQSFSVFSCIAYTKLQMEKKERHALMQSYAANHDVAIIYFMEGHE